MRKIYRAALHKIEMNIYPRRHKWYIVQRWIIDRWDSQYNDSPYEENS